MFFKNTYELKFLRHREAGVAQFNCRGKVIEGQSLDIHTGDHIGAHVKVPGYFSESLGFNLFQIDKIVDSHDCSSQPNDYEVPCLFRHASWWLPKNGSSYNSYHGPNGFGVLTITKTLNHISHLFLDLAIFSHTDPHFIFFL